jgi:hypothetical protein
VHTPQQRDKLVTDLIETYDVRRVASHACREAGIAGSEEQVGFCLVVLCQKADPYRRSRRVEQPERRYELDLGAADFADRLARWAAEVARNLSRWREAYEAIHDEFDEYEISTLSKLVQVGYASRDDDVRAGIAQKLARNLATGSRVDDMSLDYARRFQPLGSEYVFQTSLRQWVRTVATRDGGQLARAESLDEHTHAAAAQTDQLDRRRTEGEEIFRELIRHVARLRDTRELLSEALGRAYRQEELAAALRLSRVEDSAMLVRMRAEMAHVCDELKPESRAFPAMLAYVTLAMGRAPKRQRVTTLSLRSDRLQRDVVEWITARMRAAIDDASQPSWGLIEKTRRANRDRVPLNRLAELERLALSREQPSERASQLRAVTELLSQLPASVSGVAAIAAEMGEKPGTIATVRGQAAAELGTVDPMFARSFRRYAMG